MHAHIHLNKHVHTEASIHEYMHTHPYTNIYILIHTAPPTHLNSETFNKHVSHTHTYKGTHTSVTAHTQRAHKCTFTKVHIYTYAFRQTHT